MSGDSPSSHTNNIFDFKEGRVSPGPTTSKELACQSGSSVVTASVLVEPKKEESQEPLLCSPISNISDELPTAEKTLKLDDAPNPDDKSNPSDRKLNGTDKLDGMWVAPEKKVDKGEEEENCTVKCLYYTMQCCECTLM